MGGFPELQHVSYYKRLNTEAYIRIQLSSIKPDIKELCKNYVLKKSGQSLAIILFSMYLIIAMEHRDCIYVLLPNKLYEQ